MIKMHDKVRMAASTDLLGFFSFFFFQCGWEDATSVQAVEPANLKLHFYIYS